MSIASVETDYILESSNAGGARRPIPRPSRNTTSPRAARPRTSWPARSEMRSRFESPEDMEWMVNMGTVDGLQQAVGQIDGLLA
jgi:hypothetical protein